MRALLGLPIVLLVASADEPASYHYHLDEAQSRVNARVAFFGLASKTAHFPKMDGSISLQPEKLDAINLKVVLDARALTAGDSVTLARLKGKNFFDVERYPIVSFTGQRMTMTGPVTARVDGELTARGVSRPVVVQVVFAQPPARATGREPVALTARTVINRRDFGMTAYSLIVGKKVTITIDARMTPG